MTAIDTHTVPSFEDHLTNAIQDVRRTLSDLLVPTGLDPSEPQEMARRLRISRNLTWKISKVICCRDIFEAFQHLPGEEGLDILLRATRAAGATEDAAARVRLAQRELDRVIEIHTGDRATLDLIVENLGGVGSSERLEASRKTAFRGNSGVWGVQAKARSTVLMQAPSPKDPDLLDLVTIGGILDFRRLRQNVRWPLFRPRYYQADGEAHEVEQEAIDPAFAGPSGPKLLGQFCSPMPLAIDRVPEGKSFVYELADAPLGNMGTVTAFLGTIARRAAPRYRLPGDTHANFSAQLSMPAEMLLFDVFLHRDLDAWGEPESFLYGQLYGSEPRIGDFRIPVGEKAELVPGRPPAIHTSVVPQHERVIDYAMQRLGWNLRDFRVWRLMVKYPPMHSMAVMRFSLPPKP
ncbi:MAG: hypothetical protein JNK35_07085 [Phycisphaerae bacterium]|nr:hypothetical protein [Phycisphaerae bacterium]